MEQINITSAQYVSNGSENSAISAVIDNVTISVPLDLANRHYAEIMRQVDAGELTIQDAE